MPLTTRFLCACMLAWPLAARAQYTSSFGYSFNNPISASCNTMLWNRVNARMVYRRILARKGYTDAQLGKMSSDQMRAAIGVKGQAEATRSPRTAATKFQPARRRLLLPALAQGLVKDRAQQRALLELFENGLRGYEKETRSSGYVNDIAGAITFFLGVSYVVYRKEEPSNTGLELIARAVQQSLDTPQLARVPATDKQKFYELMIGLGTYLAVAHQQAVKDGDAAAAARLREVAADTLRRYLKLDPDRVRITAQGIAVSR